MGTENQNLYGRAAEEAMLAARYEQLAKFAAFDKLVDMALDGSITMEEAKAAWETELVTYSGGADGQVL